MGLDQTYHPHGLGQKPQRQDMNMAEYGAFQRQHRGMKMAQQALPERQQAKVCNACGGRGWIDSSYGRRNCPQCCFPSVYLDASVVGGQQQKQQPLPQKPKCGTCNGAGWRPGFSGWTICEYCQPQKQETKMPEAVTVVTKFCVDCRWRKGIDWATLRCVHPQVAKVQPVTGRPQRVYASEGRYSAAVCGPEGKLWEARPRRVRRFLAAVSKTLLVWGTAFAIMWVLTHQVQVTQAIINFLYRFHH